jgi:DNA-directed RNA polymerase specialized sigma24 family protein
MPRGRPSEQSQTGEREERLLIESAQRDPARFAELYDVYFNRVYTYVARRVEIRAETEDLVSDVFTMRSPT